jgi:hypothetical protein
VKIAVLPDPGELIKNEIDTLKVMGDYTRLHQSQERLAADAITQYQYYSTIGFRKAGWKVGFSFGSWLEFPESSIVKKAWIESLITVKGEDPKQYDMITYSFTLFGVKEKSENHVLRKFHIDYSNSPNTGRPPLSPIFHLQTPGELSGALREQGITDDHLIHLTPSLSEPRLSCPPTTLALLTDLLLREFGYDISPLSKLTRETYWQHLIKKDEELVLKPYFNACSQFFNDKADKKDPEQHQSFSQDFLYGQG